MENIVPTTIRIREETKKAIEDIARKEQRSFNKEIEFILLKYIKEKKEQK